MRALVRVGALRWAACSGTVGAADVWTGGGLWGAAQLPSGVLQLREVQQLIHRPSSGWMSRAQ